MPNLVYGCPGGCHKSYCYVTRNNPDTVYVNQNLDDILLSVDNWVQKLPWPKVPNQVDDKYYVVDIGCSTDVLLMQKFIDLDKVFDFFNKHPKLKSTFATKYPSMIKAWDVNSEKNRIRISVMPHEHAAVLESGCDDINVRIKLVPLISQLFETHINFSPVIYTKNWLDLYKDLFIRMRDLSFMSEVIFLTHNEVMLQYNNDIQKSLLWNSDLQESKTSNYGGKNIRYKHTFKNKLISEFKKLYSEYWSVDTIRYIF